MGNRLVIFVVATAVGFLALVATSVAKDKSTRDTNSGSFDYDPTVCTPPVTDGKIRISFGSRVLAWPFERVIPLSAARKGAIPDAPDPNAAEGCPENPVRGGDYFLSVDFLRQATDGPRNEFKKAPGRGRMIFVHPENRGRALQDLDIESTRRRCAKDKIQEIVDEIFIACRVSRGSDMLKRSVSYKAFPEVYQAPGGMPYIISCLEGPDSERPRCDVNYRLTSEINITYKVVVRSDRYPNAMTLSDILSFDRTFQTAVKAAWIKDYSWEPQ